MDLVRHGDAAAAAVAAPAPRAVAGAAEGRAERKERVAVSGSVRGAVRADLEEIFRRDYQRVVGHASTGQHAVDGLGIGGHWRRHVVTVVGWSGGE